MKRKFLPYLVMLFITIPVSSISSAQKKGKEPVIAFVELGKHCEGKPRDQRPTIVVKRFKISPKISNENNSFASQMAGKLANALQETNCFRVLEDDLEDLNEEIEMNERGQTDGNSPKRGNMMGAQAVITAEITEFTTNGSKSRLRAPGTLGRMGGAIKLGSDKAIVGITLKIVDPQTRERLYSKEIRTEGKKGGWRGMNNGVFDNETGGQLGEAMSYAMTESIYKMAERIVMDYEGLGLAAPAPGSNSPKTFNSSNCKMLADGRGPKVMVILPEYHISRRIPDPAGETEIIRKFTEAGFNTIDASMMATINGADFESAAKNPMKAISMGKKFGADIVIYGEAFSEMVDKKGNVITCRARVEAKAVRTDNAQVLPTEGKDAGAGDLSESTGSKRALRSAGAQTADYLLEQLCGKDIRFAGSTAPDNTATITGNRTVITVANTTYAKLSAMVTSLKSFSKIKDAQKKLSASEGTITLVHEGSTEEIADFITQKLASQAEVTEVNDGKISLKGK